MTGCPKNHHNPAWSMLIREDENERERQPPRRAVCPVCGGELIEIRADLECARCHTICETCCEGGRG